VICEIMDEDGTMARGERLLQFCREHRLKLITVKDLIGYRMAHERLVRKIAEAALPTIHGPFRIHAYESLLDREHHVALTMGDVASGEPVMARVHSQCLTGDIFGSTRCDCGDQLDAALQRIAHEGRGVLLYLKQEGRGIGLGHKIMAYQLQDQGQDTVEANESLGFKADQRDYGIGAQILVELGVRSLRLLTNNPRKFVGLEGYGLEIKERLPIEATPSVHNQRYLKTKKEKLGHLLRRV
jgi:3,4-dihydroxy 2-butanone 4-phosphate synthase/GTP cyclohydrolase II